MKHIKFLPLALCILLTFFFACKDKSDVKKDIISDNATTYTCPMHSDIIGKSGDKCPKCGMDLVPKNEKISTEDYEMVLVQNTAQAGQEFLIDMTPKVVGKTNSLVPLDVVHEKKIHLIVTSEDLSYFDHIHPEIQADGSYKVKHKFPNGGTYFLYADYQPTDAPHQLDRMTVKVDGKPLTAVTYAKESVTKSSPPFTITLKPDAKSFEAGVPIHFDGVFMKDGKPFDVNTLENWLGAKGHMVSIETTSKEYMHVHPEAANGSFHFNATFPKAGIYRTWLQYQYNGKLFTSDFVLNVVQGASIGQQFQCPMDCEKGKLYSKLGTCPICKMDLKAVAVVGH